MLFFEDILRYILECQLTSKDFCYNFLKQSKAFYTTLPQSKPSSLSSSFNITFKNQYVFFAIAKQVKYNCVCNALHSSNVSNPMLQMKACFLWTPLNSATLIHVFLSSYLLNLTQLFWETCSLFCKFFLRLGYHAVQT